MAAHEQSGTRNRHGVRGVSGNDSEVEAGMTPDRNKRGGQAGQHGQSDVGWEDLGNKQEARSRNPAREKFQCPRQTKEGRKMEEAEGMSYRQF